MSEDIVFLEGPIEKVDGELVLLIPLDAGGDALKAVTKSIAEVEGDILKISIPGWLATQLRLSEGDFVQVDNRDGKFNIFRTDSIS